MEQCTTCEGFLPTSASECPHCGGAITARPARRTGVDALLLSSTFVTLMACYGMAPCPELLDVDKDGAVICANSSYRKEPDYDCDDADPARRPGLPDPVGDDIDQNCDGADGIARIRNPDTIGSAVPSASASSAITSTSPGSSAPAATSSGPASAGRSAAPPARPR